MQTIKYTLLDFLKRSFDNAEKSELFTVMDKLPLKFDLEKGPWVAGGALRRLVQGQGLGDSDVDIFFHDQEQFKLAQSEMEREKVKISRTSETATEYRFTIDEDTYRIQFIHVSYYETATALLDSFDFTLCQLATDGEDLLVGEHTLWDISRKKIAVHKLTYSVASFRRLMKYCSQGYTACTGTFGDFLNKVVANPGSIQADIKYID
jgi:hypothetical protein